MMETYSYWWCQHCQEEVDGSRVTFQEKHDTCGHPVACIEGTIFSAERIAEIAQAEREGKLVMQILPYKLGSTLYEIYFKSNCHKCGFSSCKSGRIPIEICGKKDIKELNASFGGLEYIEPKLNKTIFFTRAEAETAL